MKACDQCGPSTASDGRVTMGDGFKDRPFVNRLVTVALIYLPLLTMPFVAFSAWITYLHLKMVGAKNLRPLASFLPDPKSHRYDMKSQITLQPGFPFSPLQSKRFWIANCSWYCPYSVGLFEWHTYLVKLVENWWCPFHHDRKDPHYRQGAISQSFWHIYPEEVVKLDPADRDSPIWNASACADDSTQSQARPKTTLAGAVTSDKL